MDLFTFTPNPALDLSGTVEELVPNEKMYVQKASREPGGNGLNVARVLRRLGVKVTATGFLGGGVGREVQNLLEQEKVAHHFISIAGETRVNVTVSQKKSHLQTRLNFPGPKIRRGEKEKLFSFFSKRRNPFLIMVGGSFPLGFSISDLRRFIQICHGHRAQVIVDCPGPILKEIVSSRPALIKPNLTEFQEMTGTTVETLTEVLREARKYTKKIPWICVSSVEEGALLISEKQAWFGRIPSIKVRSTVGAGDSMLAAMISKWGRDPAEILRWGLASACASLSHEGTAMGSRQEVEKFKSRTKIREIKD